MLFIKPILLFKFKGFSGLTFNGIKTSLGQRLLFYLWRRDDDEKNQRKGRERQRGIERERVEGQKGRAR